MADAITNRKLWENQQQVAYHWTNISDATGEANVAKTLAPSTFVANGGVAAKALDVDSIRWAVQGMSYVKLAWSDGTLAYLCAGSGMDIPRVLQSVVADGTPTMNVTTSGAVANGTYDITIVFNKRFQ